MKRLIGSVVAATLIAGIGVVAAPVAHAAYYEDGISWYWIKNPKCPYGSRCSQIKVKASRTSCPEGLYVEVNFLDARGNIVDYANDVVGSLQRGQKAILTFTSYNNSIKTTSAPTKINCY